MKQTIQRLNNSLTAASDGLEAHRFVSSLRKHMVKGDSDAKACLAEYMISGQLDHIREHICGLLAEQSGEEDTGLAPLFEAGLKDESIRYWCILGCSNTLGKAACKVLSEIALNETIPIEDRSHAVKCLCLISDQTFDRQLPSDPGEWEVSDIRTHEIISWVDAGYLDGGGYALPVRHAVLDEPTTSFEKIVSRFDKRLAKIRSKHQDVANPTNWLAVVAPDHVAEITSGWELPSTYLDFLTRFSPVKVSFRSKRYQNGEFELYGVDELKDAQNGYSFDPAKKKAIRGWPEDYLVIASCGGDPFVLDLTSSNGQEAPVLTSEHGTGKWIFHEEAKSFEKFLQAILR